MNDDQFTRLFKYMEQRFDSVENMLETKSDKQDVQNLMDAITVLQSKQLIAS